MTAYIWVLRRAPGPWEDVEGKQGRRSYYLPPLKRDKQRAEKGATQVASQPKLTNRTFTVWRLVSLKRQAQKHREDIRVREVKADSFVHWRMSQ